jgi:hypothetical protein
MRLILLAIILFAASAKAQDVPCGATTIVVRNISFNSICSTLLDSGYLLDRKDADLQTVSTQPRAYPKRFSATYVINVRVKDSAAYFTTTFTAPKDGSIVRNEPSTYKCKKNGKPIDNIFTYPFMLLDSFVKGLGKVEYNIK